MAKDKGGHGSNAKGHSFSGMTSPPPRNESFGSHQGLRYANKAVFSENRWAQPNKYGAEKASIFAAAKRFRESKGK